MKKITDFINSHQLPAWAGMVGPVSFVGIFTIEGLLRPDYHTIKMYVSALSLGLRGWVQIVNFVVFGTLFLMFSLSIREEFKNGKASKAGPLLFIIIAICFILSGPFVMDPMNTPREQMSLHGILHGIFGAIVFSLMPVSCFVFLRRFHDDTKWQEFQCWTLISGTIVSAAVILLSLATKLPASRHFFNEWLGLIQRTAIIPYMIWIFTFAFKIYKIRK